MGEVHAITNVQDAQKESIAVIQILFTLFLYNICSVL